MRCPHPAITFGPGGRSGEVATASNFEVTMVSANGALGQLQAVAFGAFLALRLIPGTLALPPSRQLLLVLADDQERSLPS